MERTASDSEIQVYKASRLTDSPRQLQEGSSDKFIFFNLSSLSISWPGATRT